MHDGSAVGQRALRLTGSTSATRQPPRAASAAATPAASPVWFRFTIAHRAKGASIRLNHPAGREQVAHGSMMQAAMGIW